MSLVERILRFLRPGLFVQPPHELTHGDSIRVLLAKQYPHPEAVALPRGALSRIAHDVGCSRAYVSKIAKDLGYRQEHVA